MGSIFVICSLIKCLLRNVSAVNMHVQNVLLSYTLTLDFMVSFKVARK